MTKHRHNRVARWVFRLGVAVCVLIVVATVASFWRSSYLSVAGWRIGLDFGSVYVFADWVVPVSGWGVWSAGRASQDFHLWTVKWLIPGVTVRAYPTWMFLIVALIPTYLAWRKLRRPLPGHCQQCGYDLTGNVTGVCSECGETIKPLQCKQ